MHVKLRKIRNAIDDSRMSGAVARKRCDPAEKQTVKHVTFSSDGRPQLLAVIHGTILHSGPAGFTGKSSCFS